jgi:hypothetical protein
MNFARTWDLLTRQHVAETDPDAGPYEGSNREATEKELGRYLTAPLVEATVPPVRTTDPETLALREHIRKICGDGDGSRERHFVVELPPTTEQ